MKAGHKISDVFIVDGARTPFLKMKEKPNPFSAGDLAVAAGKALLEKQNGLCAICGQPETRQDKRSNIVSDLSVDHCHKTGKVRGLLCAHSNRGLAFFRDNRLFLPPKLASSVVSLGWSGYRCAIQGDEPL